MCMILKKTCAIIWREMAKEYVKVSACTAEWVGISEEFYKIWNFPNHIGTSFFFSFNS